MQERSQNQKNKRQKSAKKRQLVDAAVKKVVLSGHSVIRNNQVSGQEMGVSIHGAGALLTVLCDSD